MSPETAAMYSLRCDHNYRWCTLWTIEREDGVVLRFTDHDHPITLEGHTFDPLGGVTASANQLKEGLQRNNVEIQGLITSDLITHEDLRGGRYNGAKVTVELRDWQYPWGGYVKHSVYWIAQTTSITEDQWTAQVEGITGRLQRNVGRVYSRTCDAELGDARCKLDMTSRTYTGTVALDSTNQTTFTSDLTVATDLLNNGKLTWTSGENDGLTDMVRKNINTSGTVSLFMPSRYNIAAGDTFTVEQGCDGKLSTCRDRFSNVVNFRGFPTIAGNMRAQRPK